MYQIWGSTSSPTAWVLANLCSNIDMSFRYYSHLDFYTIGEKSESEWEIPSFRSSKTHLGRLRLWDHMAHLMIDRVHRSGCGPMGDLRGGGPMCSGSHLTHHLVSINLGGVSCIWGFSFLTSDCGGAYWIIGLGRYYNQGIALRLWSIITVRIGWDVRTWHLKSWLVILRT